MTKYTNEEGNVLVKLDSDDTYKAIAQHVLKAYPDLLEGFTVGEGINAHSMEITYNKLLQ